MKNIYFVLSLSLHFALCSTGLFSQTNEELAERKRSIKTRGVEIPGERQEDILDTPTAALLPYGKYHINFRIYNPSDSAGASVLSKVNFGFGALNLGLYLDIGKLIGYDQIEFRKPGVAFKIRVFSGSDRVPAIGVGFNQQGYGRYQNEKYLEKEKGLYLVFSKDFLTEKMDWNMGINIFDFDRYEVYGFVGVVYELSEKAFFLAEYDNIRVTPDSRLNAGFKYHFTPEFSLSIFARNIFEDKKGIERLIRLNYEGVF